MQVTAGQIAALVNGKVEGDPDTPITAPSKIEEGGPGTISFLANPKYEHFAYQTKASALLVSEDFEPKEKITATLIRVQDVYQSLAVLLKHYESMNASAQSGQSELAFVHASAKLDPSVEVGPFSNIEAGVQIGAGTRISPQVYLGPNVQIGKGCILYPGVRVYRDCVIGDYCILHSNAVIGSDGFGFVPKADGTYEKIAQVGNVTLGERVEIGANTVVDRATMGSTRILDGAKLDNLIQIAHNVEIGENTVIAAQAGIAGSTKVGKNVMIGGQAGFVGHIEIADGVRIQAQSGIAAAIKEPGTAVYGSPAIPYKDYLRSYSVFRKLPALQEQIRQLEIQLAILLKDSK
ncbi:MAG: UDP-3-O-(3-hydroxymyristoyl)glucosamine N-acyltransferase [Saprospiraceae bacterium]|nr:UDP-3-O-(3-hydroxymyristoyl)glucosamine N-acyltransferase [Saprospiraceae bacterium]